MISVIINYDHVENTDPNELRLGARILEQAALAREQLLGRAATNALVDHGIDPAAVVQRVETVGTVIERAEPEQAPTAAEPDAPEPEQAPKPRRRRRSAEEIAAAEAEKAATALAKEAPEGVRVIRNGADAQAADVDNDIVIYNANGEKRAGFRHSHHAADILISVIIKEAPDAATLDRTLWDINKPALLRLTPEDMDRVQKACSARLMELEAAAASAGEAPAADLPEFLQDEHQGAPPAAETAPAPKLSEVQELLNEYARQKGFTALKAFMKKWNALRVGDFPADKYVTIAGELNSELAAATA